MKKISAELKQEVIEFAKANSCWKASQKYNIGAETIRYWIDPQCRDNAKAKTKKRYQAIKDTPEYKAYWNEYKEINKEACGERYLYWLNSDDNKEKLLNNVKQHRKDHLDHYKKKARERYIKNKESGILKENRQNPIQKIKHTIREGVRRALKYGQINKESPSIKYLGCTIDEFKLYIQSKFIEGMTWDNHGRGENCWHLDHITPLSSINELDAACLKRLCHYTNYQPLWEIDNLRKQDKILPND